MAAWFEFWSPGWWGQVWPNLAANVLWVPLAAVHHVQMKRHIARHVADHLEHRNCRESS